jgi:tetratricopeptide (TPR) repeat protein
MFLSQAECDAIGKIWTKEHAGKLTLAQAGYNAHLAGNWKKQNYYKPTPNEFVRAALYNWTPAQGFRSFIGQDMLKISLDRQFDDFEIPTLIFEGKWDLTWDSDKIDFMRENHPHARVEVFEKSGHAIFADEPEKFFRLLKEFLETSSKKTITYKPGNRLTWPKPLSELACKVLMVTSLPDTEERAERLSEIYRQAIEENSKEADGWERLFFTFFYKKGEAKKALEALQRYEHLAKTQDPEKLKEYSHCIKVWRGQLLDLLGRRAEAIKCYQEILRDFKYVNYNCGDVDRKWLEDHIKKPFALD